MYSENHILIVNIYPNIKTSSLCYVCFGVIVQSMRPATVQKL